MNQKDLNILKYISLAGILYILPIVAAGMNYSDDFMRSADGVFGLSIMARPLADLIFKIISLNSSSNISAAPLTHILSILSMGFSVLFLAKSLNRKYNYTDALLLSLVIFNPFYIQNLLYKFDSITMSLGVLIASVSVWLCSKQALSTKILSIALLVASLSLYQPCAGIFVAMVIIRCIDEVSRGISLNIKKYFTYLICFLVGYVSYYIFIVIPYSEGSSRSSFISLDSGMTEKLGNNLLSLWGKTGLFTPVGNELLVLLSLISFSICVYASFKSEKPIAGIFVSILAFPASYFAIGGVIIFLKESLFFPRTLVTYGLFLALLLYPIYNFNHKLSRLLAVTIAGLLVSVSFLTMSITVTAIRSQEQYEDKILNNLSYDLENLKLNSNETYISGIFNYSLYAKNAVDNNGIAKLLSNRGYDWTVSYKLRDYGLNVPFSFRRDTQKKLIKSICRDRYNSKTARTEYTIYQVSGKNLVNIGGDVDCR